MKPLYILLLLLCKVCNMLNVLKSSDIIQDTGIRTAEMGENVTLPCTCHHASVIYLYWYRQSLEGKPDVISQWMKHRTEADIYPAYKKRFHVFPNSKLNTNDLLITNLQPSDSGTYYCVVLEFSAIEFGQGVFLHVKNVPLKIQVSIRQPAVKPLQLGDSVNLTCSVSAEHCEGDRSLYWFRRSASQPALMYASKGHCESASNGKLYGINFTCNLELSSLLPTDAGTYHCALASCGVVVFGEGTKVEIVVSPLLVYCLSLALALSTAGLVVLCVLRYKLKSKLGSSCRGTGKLRMCSESLKTAESQTESLHYAALNLNRVAEGQQQEGNIESVCVYSRVRSRKE